MSSSISSFSLPLERSDAELRAAQSLREQKFVGWLCRLSPILFVAGMIFGAYLLVPMLYLKPIPQLSLASLLGVKAFAGGVLLAAFPWIWRLSFSVDRRLNAKQIPCALLGSLLFITVVNLAITQPRVRWAFVEWAKVRTPNPSFARNTLFWEQREFESRAGTTPPARRIALVGSSQTYQSTDLDLLASLTNDRWEKNCLAGFGPMQYPWLSDRLLERRPDVVVCWLSEFDFYREESIPTSRLAWAASPRGVVRLASLLAPSQLWRGRGELADLSLAATVPVWRLRDHLRRTALGYWWNVSRPADGAGDQQVVLAESAGLAGAIENLQENVGRTSFREVNFRSFAMFADRLHEAGIELIVFEGQLHPVAAQSLDPAFHLETRQRLQELASQHYFQYLSGDDVLTLTVDDFADAYHTNAVGRERWTRFVAQTLRQRGMLSPTPDAEL
ncbi:MAG: hypothetical protein KDA58_03695 [Planctomycetaceae bacterium]|nr:hypothetical protein [Planctomycetaceae bacterium]